MADSDMGGMCACSYDGDGYATVYRKDHHKARKRHVCCECPTPIEPGERYEYVFSVYDGDATTYKTHMSCAGIRRDFCCDIHGSVFDTFQSAYGFNPFEVPE